MNKFQLNGDGDISGIKLISFISLGIILVIIGLIIFYPFLSLGQQSNDNGVKKDLAAMRSQSELYYTVAGGGSYGSVPDGTVCSQAISISQTVFNGTSSLQNLIKFAGLDGAKNLTCAANATSWSVIATLPSETSNWCVDSLGNAQTAPIGSKASGKGC